jgi:hypothetical protein
LSTEALPKPVQIVSADELRARAAERDVAYLRFQPAEREDGTVRLTLEARLASRDPGRPTLGLSGIQVRFHEIAGRWEAAGEPVLFAG